MKQKVRSSSIHNSQLQNHTVTVTQTRIHKFIDQLTTSASSTHTKKSKNKKSPA